MLLAALRDIDASPTLLMLLLFSLNFETAELRFDPFLGESLTPSLASTSLSLSDMLHTASSTLSSCFVVVHFVAGSFLIFLDGSANRHKQSYVGKEKVT